MVRRPVGRQSADAQPDLVSGIPDRAAPGAEPLARALNQAPRVQSLVQMQRRLNDSPGSRSLAQLNGTLNTAQGPAQRVAQLNGDQSARRPGTRSQNPELFSMQDTPRSGGGSFMNILPQEDEMTPMMQLTNEMEMLVNQVGPHAPQTVSYSSGLQPVTPYPRPRESNEQGRGILNLAQQQFPPPTPFTNDIRTANTMMPFYPNAPLLPNMQGNIQSLHGVARSLGPVESGRDPYNYIGGSQVSNLAMTGTEHALGSLPPQQRNQFSMETMFYSDPQVPLAHGINMQVFHQNYPTPVMTANYTGFDTSTTRQQVERQLSSNRSFFGSIPTSGGQHYSEQDEQQMQIQYPNYSPQEIGGATTMLNMPHTVVLGQNPWEQNTRRL